MRRILVRHSLTYAVTVLPSRKYGTFVTGRIGRSRDLHFTSTAARARPDFIDDGGRMQNRARRKDNVMPTNQTRKCVGILTSGGDCPGLNAVIRGVVKSAGQLGYACVGFLRGYEGLADPVQYRPLDHKNTTGILAQGGTILGSTNKGRFAARAGADGRIDLDPLLLAAARDTVEQVAPSGLICIGGDGSLLVAQQFHEFGIPVVGVPKTIDNDLSATAFTFGFDSAVACATDALDRLHTTAASHDRIIVLEVMGRHAGWIALHAGIAGGGDVILIPEVPWTFEGVCDKILQRDAQGKTFTLVVVAEGATLPDGSLVGRNLDAANRQALLGGVGQRVADELERRLHRDVRCVVLGHLQRGGGPTTFDRVLATQFGAHAMRLVYQHRFGEMVTFRPPDIDSVPLGDVVNELSRVKPNSSAVQAARALGISFGDRPANESPFADLTIVPTRQSSVEPTAAARTRSAVGA
jgi:6-phosphofructokinase 1